MSTKPRGTENSSATKQQLIAEADADSLSRAQENVYEFVLAGEEHVNVKNTSYDETGHVYTVAVEDGLPARCTCPAFEHHDGPCKHQLAVAIRAPTPATDGGQKPEPSAEDGTEAGEPACFGEACTGLDGEGMTCFACHLRDLEHYPEGSVVAPVPSSNGEGGGQ